MMAENSFMPNMPRFEILHARATLSACSAACRLVLSIGASPSGGHACCVHVLGEWVSVRGRELIHSCYVAHAQSLSRPGPISMVEQRRP